MTSVVGTWRLGLALALFSATAPSSGHAPLVQLEAPLWGPAGLYALGDKTTNGLRDHSFVNGFTLRLRWSELETEPGVYDFSLVDAALDFTANLASHFVPRLDGSSTRMFGPRSVAGQAVEACVGRDVHHVSGAHVLGQPAPATSSSTRTTSMLRSTGLRTTSGTPASTTAPSVPSERLAAPHRAVGFEQAEQAPLLLHEAGVGLRHPRVAREGVQHT
ncbi:MAG TPA: hypothetical protein VM686_26280, partial [Polyangiaceae bacterium]|nr:hypothetical protein [Polyangiaceae bacterium]